MKCFKAILFVVTNLEGWQEKPRNPHNKNIEKTNLITFY